MKNKLLFRASCYFHYFWSRKFNIPAHARPYSGSKYVDWYARFCLTGILLPFITVIVVAFYDEGVESVGNRIHPWFGFIFAVVIYMSIGAFYGIPRAANVAYEIGTRHILPVHNQWTLIIFAAIFLPLFTGLV